jgi:hypothetical protein
LRFAEIDRTVDAQRDRFVAVAIWFTLCRDFRL